MIFDHLPEATFATEFLGKNAKWVAFQTITPKGVGRNP